ncbi:MAG TPA: hypothetical protein VIC03_11120 [Gemmatimonadaceae bacterium]|jgi:hypothetical protein
MQNVEAKRPFSRRTALAIILGLLAAVAAPNAGEAAQGCNNRTLRGDYAAAFVGLGLPGSVPLKQAQKVDHFYPGAANGILSFDGQGAWSFSGSQNFGGTYFSASYHGSYVVHQNCAGHFSDAPDGINWDFIVFHNGDRVNAIDATGSVEIAQIERVDE